MIYLNFVDKEVAKTKQRPVLIPLEYSDDSCADDPDSIQMMKLDAGKKI